MAIQNRAAIISHIKSHEGDDVEVSTLSNLSEVNQVDVDVSIVKAASSTWALPDGNVDIVALIVNNTSAAIENFHFKDTLVGATFVAGSLKIGSIIHDDLDPVAGFEMQVTLGPGADMTVTYTAKVDKFPPDEVVKATSSISFSVGEEKFSLTSNDEVVEVLSSGLTMLKSATPTAAITGSEITYTIDVSNDGTHDNTSVVFSDTLPAELEFVTGSVTIDGTPQPTYTLSSIPLSDLSPGDSVKISFRAVVK